jgi:hypothetical protein
MKSNEFQELMGQILREGLERIDNLPDDALK